jgi:hypothetical protein
MQNTEAAAAFLGKRPLKRIPGDDIAEVENEEHTQFPPTFCADKAAGSSRDPFSVFSSFFILPSLFFLRPCAPRVYSSFLIYNDPTPFLSFDDAGEIK